MKKKIVLLILTILLILIIVNLVLRREKIVKIDEIEERIEISKTEGVMKNFYKKGENEPFTGKIVKDFENDGISFEFNVKNGKLDGNTTVYYSSGQIQSERTYEKGVPINEAKYYYEDGQLQVFIDYKNKIKKTYYGDGALYAEMKFLGNDEWKYEGEVKLYYQTGEILGIEQFKKGVLDGESVDYYKNGKIRRKCYYKDGTLEGEATNYYENGNVEE